MRSSGKSCLFFISPESARVFDNFDYALDTFPFLGSEENLYGAKIFQRSLSRAATKQG